MSNGFPDVVRTNEFFSTVFGFNESLAAVSDNISVEADADGFHKLHSSRNGKTYECGRFSTPTIAELRSQVDTIQPLGGGTFSLILGNGVRTSQFELIDVGAIQAARENNGATFQVINSPLYRLKPVLEDKSEVASNFNCLEFISPHDSAARGITKYVGDHTQGPAGSISAAPATLFRNYFVKHTGRDGKVYTGQLEAQVELLSDVPIIPIKNGYVHYNGESFRNLKGCAPSFPWSDLSSMRVGVHEGVQVTSGMKTNALTMCQDPNQRVNQVFTAAMNMAGIPFGIDSDDTDVVKSAQYLLNAAYLGTILSAIINANRLKETNLPGRSRLYLTLIGGGVFRNKPHWIVDAIVACKDLIAGSGLDVQLVMFGGEGEVGHAAFKRLEELVAATSGQTKYAV